METKDLKDLEQIHDVVALRVVLCPQEEESDKNKPQLLLGATNTANTDNNNNDNESSNKGRGVWLTRVSPFLANLLFYSFLFFSSNCRVFVSYFR